MLILISPAKKLDYASPFPPVGVTQPRLLAQAQCLVDQLKDYPPQQLASLMHLSDALASLNAARFAGWQQPFTSENAKPAVFAFNGDVYEGLGAASLGAEALAYAQGHLRILSGLYGVLRPFDLMQAYRLEMGTALQTARGKDLYAFWGSLITDTLNADLAASGSDGVVNLASEEYFKSVKRQALRGHCVTPVFKDWSKGQYKVISFFAKKARGMMVRHLLEQQAADRDTLLAFNGGGYAYHPELTKHADEPVFTRRME